MYLVYPLGFPVALAVILYRSKDDIIYRDIPLGDEAKENERAIRLAAISSLFEIYTPEYWYWYV